MEIKCEGTCNNNGMDSTYAVTIPRDRYEELMDMETRANVIKSMAIKDGDKYMDVDVLLTILGDATGGR